MILIYVHRECLSRRLLDPENKDMEVSLGSIILESVIEFDTNGGSTISYNQMF